MGRLETYAAPVPLPALVPDTKLVRILSLYGMTIPMQRAPPTKKNIRRYTKEVKAFFINLRGFCASPAAMEINSGPTML